MKTKKIVMLLVVAAALAAGTASWKWNATTPHKVAGWSWSDSVTFSLPTE